ncbi:MAG: DUF2071 domain-containing protein [Bacteroidota bacterium]|nr:DUF2071 domain-containing protein [Bacteroidota bacterium]
MEIHFLRAEWNNLIMANFVVPKELLLPYVPYKTELDFFEGNSYASLVGYMFLNTKIHGFSIPFHINFEEVDLRFYVKLNDHGHWKRGVVFIKKIVPRQGILLMANNLYGEKYTTMKMNHYHVDKGECLEAGYEWEYKNKWNQLVAKTDKKSALICKASHEEFIADHYWGYTKSGDTRTYEYSVEHPVWEILKVIEYSVNCDFGSIYGKRFSVLNKAKPQSVFLTRGSEVKVHRKKVIE